MDVLTTVSTVLGSVKVATEIAQFLRSSDLTLEKAEAKNKLADLIGALADVKMQLADVRILVLDKDEEIRQLQEELKEKRKVFYKDPFYWREGDDGQKEGPFCQVCYDKDQKLSRLQVYGYMEKGDWKCKVCGQRFHDRSQVSPKSSNSSDDRGGSWMAR